MCHLRLSLCVWNIVWHRVCVWSRFSFQLSRSRVRVGCFGTKCSSCVLCLGLGVGVSVRRVTTCDVCSMTSAPRGAFTSPGRSPGRRRRCTLGRGAPPWRPRDRTTAILLEASTRSLSCSIPGRGERASLTSLRVENWNIVSKSASISLIFKRGRRGRDGRTTRGPRG